MFKLSSDHLANFRSVGALLETFKGWINELRLRIGNTEDRLDVLESTPDSVSGATDHGALTGLADDDHTQYHNNARGDARYSQLGHTHAEIADHETRLDAIESSTRQIRTDVYELADTGATWTKQSWAKSIDVLLIGGGGGGGGGARGGTGVAVSGGSGGAGGCVAYYPDVSPSVFGATETVTVGAGGTGGVPRTTDSTIGTSGTSGGTTSFGIFRAQGGGNGTPGSLSATSPSGTPSTISNGCWIAGTLLTNAATSVSTTTGVPGNGRNGGYLTTGNASNAGTVGCGVGNGPTMVSAAAVAGGSAGTANGGAGGAGQPAGSFHAGTGGGGGGGGDSGATIAGGKGGAGGLHGGGGGGGGGSRNGINSGAGGDGAPGIVVIVQKG